MVRVHLSPFSLKRINFSNGGVAQLGEHLPCKQGVKSSNLSVSIQACFTSEEIRECTHRDLRAKENAFESTQERAIEDCECGVGAKRLNMQKARKSKAVP